MFLHHRIGRLYVTGLRFKVVKRGSKCPFYNLSFVEAIPICFAHAHASRWRYALSTYMQMRDFRAIVNLLSHLQAQRRICDGLLALHVQSLMNLHLKLNNNQLMLKALVLVDQLSLMTL